MKLVYYILGSLLAGMLLLIFLQLNSYMIINRLVKGNQQVSDVFRLEKKLFDLRLDIASLEDKMDSILQHKDQGRLAGMKIELVIEHDMTMLRLMDTTSSAGYYINQLDRIVHRKIDISNQILDTFYSSGKAGVDRLMEDRFSSRLTDSITFVSHQFEQSRHELLGKLTGEIDSSGVKARRLGYIMTALILLGGIGGTFFIISWIQRQNGLIAQLDESRLREKESVAVKEKFLANMSHEIRTPLNAVLGFTHLLQNKKLDVESTGYIRSIRKSGEDLLAIVNDILDLSKIEAGMMRIECYPFSLRQLIHSTRNLFIKRMENKGLSFLIQIDDTVPDMLEGDASRLTQVLVNLIDNAIKFTQYGHIALRVNNNGIEGRVIQLGFEVKDTGIGIHRDKLSTVFNRFGQAEDSITRRYGGTGLGLSIVAELVQLQGGRIQVESQEGKGAAFCFHLPYTISSGQEGQPDPAGAPLPVMVSPGLFHAIRVLVVEDNEMNRLLMAGILGNWGIAYDLADGGHSAIEQLRTNTYHLVLMDLQMPGMDGYAATDIIRHDLGLSVPVIAMTAHVFSGERQKCLAHGMNEYLAKPVRVEVLYALITDLLHLDPALLPNTGTPEGLPYQYLRLDYMKSISRGNKGYEQKVSEQFIKGVNDDLLGLSDAAALGDITRIRKTAHNMKTTVSIMGLEDPFLFLLEKLEAAEGDAESYNPVIEELAALCRKAEDEVKLFLRTL